MTTIQNQKLKDMNYTEVKSSFTRPENPIKYKSLYHSSEYLSGTIKNWANMVRISFFGIIWVYFSLSLIWYIVCNIGIAQKIIGAVLTIETDHNIPSIICKLVSAIDISRSDIFITFCVSLVAIYFIKKKYQKDKSIDDIDIHSEN